LNTWSRGKYPVFGFTVRPLYAGKTCWVSQTVWTWNYGPYHAILFSHVINSENLAVKFRKVEERFYVQIKKKIKFKLSQKETSCPKRHGHDMRNEMVHYRTGKPNFSHRFHAFLDREFLVVA